MVGSKENQGEEECNMMVRASPQVTISYNHFTQEFELRSVVYYQ
jgi:hypothetical protein